MPSIELTPLVTATESLFIRIQMISHSKCVARAEWTFELWAIWALRKMCLGPKPSVDKNQLSKNVFDETKDDKMFAFFSKEKVGNLKKQQ